MKRLTHEKMKEMEELASKKEHADSEKYKAVLEKGQENLEKYKKMAVMTQNVLRVRKNLQSITENKMSFRLSFFITLVFIVY